MKSSNIGKNKIIIISIIIGIIFLISSILYIIYNRVDIKLNGSKIVNATVNVPYLDDGVVIKIDGMELDKNKYSLKVINNVNINDLGDYKVIYKIKYLWNRYTKERIVHVVDNVKPEIIVSVDEIEKDYCTKETITDYTYTSIDNYDGDITSDVKTIENDEEIVFISSDKSGNINKLSIPLIFKKNDPEFRLNGNSTIYLSLYDKYTEQGATNKDECGNNLSDKVNITGSVDTSKIGVHNVIYTYGNKQLIRKVVVEDFPSANGKVLYLTFDDGPGVYTERVLNTLAKYNVKATFFVTHQFGSYVPLIKREYEEGHAIGVHTYTHEWNVYSSVDSYLNDFNKMNNDIRTYTGNETKIFRFPGGSSNEISRNYAYGVVSAIANRMTNDGYVYFDWDVDSGDANGGSTSSIYNRVINGASNCSQCVILMHDIKINTVNELDNILNTLTRRGYTFGTLNTGSPMVHHKIVN